jgi:hypothetical protein
MLSGEWINWKSWTRPTTDWPLCRQKYSGLIFLNNYAKKSEINSFLNETDFLLGISR